MKLFLVLNFFLLAGSVWGKAPQSELSTYLKLQKKFSRSLCGKGEDDKYYQLLKNYRSDGFFLPSLEDKRVDYTAIEENLPLLQEKKKWLEEQFATLSKMKQLPAFDDRLIQIEQLLHLILLSKERILKGQSVERELLKSKEMIFQLREFIGKLREELPFFLNFKSPVDYLALRQSYEEIKDDKSKEREQNTIYLKRKIIEDGAMDEDHRNFDLAFRSTFDSLWLALRDYESGFLQENLRFDIHYILNEIEKKTRRGLSLQIQRMVEWKQRTVRMIDFYQNIVNEKSLPEKNKPSSKRILRKSKDRFQLQDFVLKKQAEVFSFWKRQSTRMKALFALETILYNEVGRLDGPGSLERQAVAQVVKNRIGDPEYSVIDEHDAIFPYLKKFSLKKIQIEHWLGALLKEGEFSFTYYFIPETVRVFCPDMSRSGQTLRKKNLKIALSSLSDARSNFRATRYYSRISMIGRIDMAKVWSDFEILPESPGIAIRGRLERELRAAIGKMSYKYLYSFDLDKKNFDVIESLGHTLVMHKEDNRLSLHYYRNPHLFSYFSKRKKI